MADLLAPFAGNRAAELASTLRQEFGSLGRALSAPSHQLMRVGREFAPECEMLIAARRLVDEARREILVGSRVTPADPVLLDYLRDRLCRGRQETLLVMFCDPDGHYIIDEELAWGNEHSVQLDSARLFRRALTLDAGAILLAHNHPSGDCTPSAQDVSATRTLANMGDALGLRLIDHVIVTGTAAYSMRAGGSL